MILFFRLMPLALSDRQSGHGEGSLKFSAPANLRAAAATHWREHRDIVRRAACVHYRLRANLARKCTGKINSRHGDRAAWGPGNKTLREKT